MSMIWRWITKTLQLANCVCPQRISFHFCLNPNDLEQEPAGSSAARAGREDRGRELWGCVCQGLDSLQEAIKQSKKARECQACIGKCPRRRQEYADRTSLLTGGENRMGPGGQSCKRNPVDQQGSARGTDAGHWVYSKSPELKIIQQVPKTIAEGIWE